MQILLVEDDSLLADGIIKALVRERFAVNHVKEGKTALNHINVEPPDILILDLGLPDIDGLELLNELRKKNSTLPVLILTARDLLDDKLKGLDSGADDYITKPFELKELIARLRVLERRLSHINSNEISIGDVTLNTTTLQTTVKNETLKISKREYMLLKALMESSGAILTKENLEAKLYSWGEEIASNAIEVHIHNLRKKLPEDYIQTVHGMGYIIKK